MRIGVPPDGKLGQHDGWFLRTAWPHLAEGQAGKGASAAEAERTRLLKAQADTAELRLAKESGKLVEVDKVARTFATTWREVRDILRMVPMSIVDEAMEASADGRRALKDCLKAGIDDALTRASKVRVEVPEEETEDAAA